jgi:membrane protein YdbS with pleckstrin-like domain
MNDSDYTRLEKALLITLFVVLMASLTLQWFVVGSDGWLGWLGVAVVAVAIVITLHARVRFRRLKAVRADIGG